MGELTQQNDLEKYESVYLLYKNNRVGLYVTLILSFVLVFAFDHQRDMDQRLIWLVVMSVIVLARFIDYRLYISTPNTEKAHRTSEFLTRFSVGNLSTALGWGAYGIVFHDTSSFITTVSTIVILASLAGGSVNFLSSNRGLAIAYSALVLFPYSLLLTVSESSGFHIFGWLGVFFSLVMVSSAISVSRFTKQAISHKYQNLHLISNMEKEISQRTEQLDRLSRFDSLTNLLNRYGFLKELERIQNKSAQYSVMFLDLDGFKSINDRLSHSVGDELLRQTAERLKGLLSQSDVVSRWGGDEFLILTQDTENLRAKAERIISEISKPYPVNHMSLSIGVTIGISSYPEHGHSYDVLIQNADIAMYQQKKTEKGRVSFFSYEMHEKYNRELYLKDSLDEAMDNNDLELYYQPIMDVRTNTVASFEALCRWTLNGETISPEEFIAVAEQHGRIQRLGCWVLRKACEDAALISEVYPDAAIGINVSLIQFQDDEFVELIEQVLEETQVTASKIHLELTESVFALDKGSLLRRIERVREMGIKVSLDDFGTGYSSLSVIQDIGVDVIKIDRAFINNISKNGSAIIGAVAHMSQSMGQGVVAEGVETQEQADRLIASGIYHHQGFLYNKPMPLSELIEK